MEALDTGYGVLLSPTSLFFFFFVFFFFLFYFHCFYLLSLAWTPGLGFLNPRLGAYSELQYPRDGLTIGISLLEPLEPFPHLEPLEYSYPGHPSTFHSFSTNLIIFHL